MLSRWVKILFSLGLLFSNSYAWAAPAVENPIDRIEILGVTVFQSGQVESALEISPGDFSDSAKIRRSRDNLINLYRVHGYEKARVDTELVRDHTPSSKDLVLNFYVREGLATRVAAIDFVIDSGSDANFEKNWQTTQKDLLEKLGVAIGDIFDQEKISQSRHSVTDVLASSEYIGAKVNDVRVMTTTPPTGALKSPVDNAKVDHWVQLVFHVDLGDRVSFGFRGNEVFTTNHLQSLIDEQRELGLGKDYVEAIKNRLEDEYRTEGYARVSIQAFPQEKNAKQERHITYVINEGIRVRLGEIDFDGNSVFSKPELKKLFLSKASIILQNGYYVEKDIKKASDLLIESLKSQGYLAAKLVTINTSFTQGLISGVPWVRAKITLYIYEGDQTLVEGVTFDGMNAMGPEEAKKYLSLKVGGPLDLYAFNEGIERFKKAYRNLGYLGVQISNEGSESVVHYSENNRLADIHLILVEGPQFRVSKIEIEGLSLTKLEVVKRELIFHEGEILHEDAITESESKLKRLGIFAVVTIHVTDDPEKPGYKIVRVSLQEGTPGLVAGGPGFRNDLGVRAFGQAAYTNLWGLNHTLSLQLTTNRRLGASTPSGNTGYRFLEYQGQISYLWPYFAGIQGLSFRPTVTQSATEYVLFDATATELDLTWEKPILTSPNLVGSLTYSLERVNQFNAGESLTPGQVDVIDDGVQLIGSITPALRLDLRDNPLAPTSGFFATASFELASPWFGSQNGPEQNLPNSTTPNPVTGPIGYYRFQLRTDYSIPLPSDIVWYLSFRTGYERNDEADGQIPLIKQFALGGIGSLRGFQEQQLNYQATSIQGTLTYVNYRTQIDFPFTGALKVGPFLDAANLLLDQYTFWDLRTGAGIGLHYQSPVGPINFDWGFNLAPRDGEDPYEFYFSIGVL